MTEDGLFMKAKKSLILLVVMMALMLVGCRNPIEPDIFAKDDEYVWMSLDLPWRIETTIPYLEGSHSKAHFEPSIYLEGNEPFTLYITLGSNEMRCYAVVGIKSSGAVIAAYKDPQTMRYYQRKFSITKQQVSALREVLNKNKAGSFAASYVDSKELSGTQGGFTLVAGGMTRRTFFSNDWPSSFRDITEYVCDHILQYKAIGGNYGYKEVSRSIMQVEPEATFAVRGLVQGR